MTEKPEPTPPETLDPVRIVGLLVADLIRVCPSCDGSGEPTIASGPAGLIALECDCSGFGYWVSPAAVDRFRIVEAVLDHDWFETELGRHAALTAFLISWCEKQPPRNTDYATQREEQSLP